MAVKKAIIVVGLWGGAFSALGAETIIVHWERPIGVVKPVNGIGQPPMVGQLANWSMMHYLKEAGVPYSRLHDVGGWMGRGLYVDVPNLFPDFEADEDDSTNYRFAYTDDLINALVKNDVEPFFRLGVSIENFVERGLPPVRCRPPEDFAKWARICEHVIRHYTEGWANGFRHKITYWEIWNEPDNQPDETRNPCWHGSFDEFIRFYGVVAPYLKEKFPHLKIGGYSSCGFYAGVGAGRVKAANSSPRLSYFVDCATNFLATARTEGWPLDFFSFHSYSAPGDALRQVRYADELLTHYGFDRGKTERVFNEWLPFVGRENLGSGKQAAGIAAELIGLQNGPCDVACLYDARCDVGSYSPLFNPLSCKPHRAYAAFTAFNELRRCGTSVAVQAPAELQVAAARGKNGAAAMIANSSAVARPLVCDFGSCKVLSCRLTDATHMDDVVPLPSKLGPHSFAVILLGGFESQQGPSCGVKVAE